MNSLSDIVPDIKYLLSPILDTAQKNGKKMGDIILSEVNTVSSGCWNIFLYMLMEKRNRYILKEIVCMHLLQYQYMLLRLILHYVTNQYFYLGLEIMINLYYHTSFVYNGNFVTHCQAYNPKGNTCTMTFYNTFSCDNQKIQLFTIHIFTYCNSKETTTSKFMII